MAKTTNPYWREESRIYHLELEIARTSNPQKKRELGYLLEKEKTALQQRKWRDREARNYQIKTIRKTRRRKIVYYTCRIAGIIIVSFFIISKFFYPNVEKLDLENHPATNFITQHDADVRRGDCGRAKEAGDTAAGDDGGWVLDAGDVYV